jgi:hypothetical protein
VTKNLRSEEPSTCAEKKVLERWKGKKRPTLKEDDETLSAYDRRPSESVNRSELKAITGLTIEYRQRTNDWLHILALGEFPNKRMGYRLSARYAVYMKLIQNICSDA